MKSSCLIRLSAIFILIAFAISFCLPVVDGLDRVGWQVARDTMHDTFYRNSNRLFRDQDGEINWILVSLLDLANLVTPVVLVMLSANWFRGRIRLFLLVVLALCAANSSRFAFDPKGLLIGYWVWWGCQVATLAIGIWSRFRPIQMLPAPVVPAKG
jgi:hypothetical protein